MANNYKKGDRDNRPWGTWEVLDSGDGFCVKRICVTPGNILSLQSHQNNTDKNMEFIEVQTGETLDENDIIRYEDSYGRAG